MNKWLTLIRDKYIDPNYPFQDRLYFLFGTAGVLAAGAAFAAAVVSGLPWIAAAASLTSFVIMLAIIAVSFFVRDISICRVVCSVFLNFFMFPVLFWVTGGVECGMVFYFLLGLCVAALILNGRVRAMMVTGALLFYSLNLYLGFQHPELTAILSPEARQQDIVSSFIIVALFIIAVLFILTLEYQKEHEKVLAYNTQLQRQLVTDSLTTLYNHRYLQDELAKYIAGFTPDQDTLSIAMFDIDNFKHINDTYGHLRGNQALSRFAAILQEAAPAQAMATRFGGEEFIVVLPGCDLIQAIAAAEAIRLAVWQDPELKAIAGPQFSVSGGVAQYAPGLTQDILIERADAKLYEAKRSGKNKICG